jgi:transcriptional regulator with XRE-family HTH domain
MDSKIASIKERRKILGWSQKDLAEKASVPHSAVVRIERGLNNWPQYIETINNTLDKELKSFKFK